MNQFRIICIAAGMGALALLAAIVLLVIGRDVPKELWGIAGAAVMGLWSIISPQSSTTSGMQDSISPPYQTGAGIPAAGGGDRRGNGRMYDDSH